jgi:hypothetical protein
LAALLCVPVAAVAADESRPAQQVGAKEWSYQAIEDLAARGLVQGYKDSKFLDGRTLTRYEMATLVKRVIDTVLEIPTPSKDATVTGKPGTAAARNVGLDPIPTGKAPAPKVLRTANFTESDLGTIKRLADTYSVELAVIGVNLQEANDKFTELEGRVEALESSLRDPEGPLQTVISNVARLDKVRFSGYLQARYQALQEGNERTSSDRPIAAVDSFTIRRMRLTVNARPTEKIGIKWQFEGANLNLETRDAWIDYYVKGDPAQGPTWTFGQFKAPFGFEIVQSSSVREVPERARIARFFWPDERDRGIKYASSTGGKVFYEVAIQNGTNLGSRVINSNDNNNNKNVLGRVRTTLLNGRLDLGTSFELGNVTRTNNFPGESGIGSANPRQNAKNVYGVDFQWFPIDGTMLRGEWMGGRSLGSDVSGYILTFVQNVGKKHQAVARYDWFGADDYVTAQIGSPGSPLGAGVYRGTLSALNLGWIYHLDESTRLKMFYEINKRGTDKVNGNDFQWFGNLMRFEVITLF